MEQMHTGAEDVRWDLTIMYVGIDDPTILEDITRLGDMAKAFSSAYKGKLKETLGVAIEDYIEITMLAEKIGIFLSLKQSTDVADSQVKAKLAWVNNQISYVQGEYLTFFELELMTLSEADLMHLASVSPIAAKHMPWIKHAQVFKSHVLSEPVESALTKRAPFGVGAWSSFFEEVTSDLRFYMGEDKKTLTEMLHIVTNSKDEAEREIALRLINEGFAGAYAKHSAEALYIVTGSGALEDKEREYKHPMDARNKSNHIPDAVVDMVHRVVKETAAPLAQRYYRLKAAHLGLKTLKWSDRNASISFVDTTMVPYEEAEALVLNAYESFSVTLADIIRGFIRDKWIDAPATKAKRGGAFSCSTVLPGNRPVAYTFLNYLGSGRDVMTLAHELGHGVHGMVAGKAQGALMAHAPIAYCETASVFGEMTTFNFLKKRLVAEGDKKSLLALLMGKVDDIINTVVRQIGFSNFERRIHGMDKTYRVWEEPKKLSAKELDNIWLETAKELYGQEGEIFTYKDTEHLWAYISHFHNPFYVYGYAFGELLTHSIYAQQDRLGDAFEPRYLDLLASGNTRNVVELLMPMGLDPSHEQFWENGVLLSLGKLIEEAEDLSREMGIVIQ